MVVQMTNVEHIEKVFGGYVYTVCPYCDSRDVQATPRLAMPRGTQLHWRCNGCGAARYDFEIEQDILRTRRERAA